MQAHRNVRTLRDHAVAVALARTGFGSSAIVSSALHSDLSGRALRTLEMYFSWNHLKPTAISTRRTSAAFARHEQDLPLCVRGAGPIQSRQVRRGPYPDRRASSSRPTAMHVATEDAATSRGKLTDVGATHAML
jgi:hypothetical protein